MSIKPLIILPDPVLRQLSKPVERVDAPLRRLADDMLETMYDAPGIGLAAIQIGEPLRMLVIDLAKEGEPRAPQVFINPEIVSQADERSVYEEGCLSIPGITIDCKRALHVVAHGFDMYGERTIVEGSEMLARALQHETDHLDGIMFIDRLDKESRREAMKLIRESEWFGQPAPTVRFSPHATNGLGL